MERKGDNTPFLGSINCKDIAEIELLTDENNFGFKIDSGKQKYTFSTSTLA